MAWIVFTFLTISLLYTAATLVHHTYSRGASMSGKVPIDVTPVSVRSMGDCAAICNQHDQCQSFYHSAVDMQCFLDTDDNLSNFTEDDSASYFSKNGYTDIVLSTTAETSTEPSSSLTTQLLTSSCPAIFQEDLLLIGTSGNNYTYKVFHSHVSLLEATFTCLVNSMQLIKMNEDDKIRDLTSFLTLCDVYDAGGYWTDASKYSINGISDYWSNLDGIGTILDIAWCSGTPEYNGNNNCARLNRACSFKLNEIACEASLSFICE